MDNKRRNTVTDDPYSVNAKKRNLESKRVFIRKPFMAVDAYTKHKILVNQYLLDHVGATKELQRDSSKDKTDLDVLKANHKFLWEDDDGDDTWEKRVAKKYYEKLFKEYCISDLTRYKENKIALRWRIEKEVIDGKGQFICADMNCNTKDHLKSWEVNFAYREHGEKKNALVKIRLCSGCSYKLNYRHKRKEIKKQRKESKLKRKIKEESGRDSVNRDPASDQSSTSDFALVKVKEEKEDESKNIWKSNQSQIHDEPEPNIESEMDEYLSELFM